MNAMFKFLLVFISVFISTGNALTCYTCNSDRVSNCVRGSSEMKETVCGLEHSPLLRFCILRTVYDKLEKKETVEANCESIRKPVGREGNKLIQAPDSIIVLDRNVQQCQSNERYNVTFCDVCKTDLCNFASSAPDSKLNFFNFWWIIMLYIFAKFVFR